MGDTSAKVSYSLRHKDVARVLLANLIVVALAIACSGSGTSSGGIVTIPAVASTSTSPPSAFIDAWQEEVASVCATIEESYWVVDKNWIPSSLMPDSPATVVSGEGVPDYEVFYLDETFTPIADRVESTFDLAIEPASGTCDAGLLIEVGGTPKGAQYGSIGFSFEGAVINGRLTMSSAGQDDVVSEFRIEKDPPPILSSPVELGARSPESAINNAISTSGELSDAFEAVFGCFAECPAAAA